MMDGIPVTGPNLFLPKGHYWQLEHGLLVPTFGDYKQWGNNNNDDGIL